MKRRDLVTMVDLQLEAIGFTRGAWVWQPRSSELYVVIGGAIRAVKLKTSMTRRALVFEMGRIAGLAEAAGMQPAQISAIPANLKSLNGASHTLHDNARLALGTPA